MIIKEKFNFIDELIDPETKSKLELDTSNSEKVVVKNINGKEYVPINGILDLYLNSKGDELNNIQSEFYNEIKFPNYDNIDNFGTLLKKGDKSIFGSKLDEEIPIQGRVLEAGCGTGQMSLYLSRFNREIFGIDLSHGSLLLAEKFKIENDIDNVNFLRMNLRNLFFKDNYFDVIISNGVLHHTSDPKQGFINLTNYLKDDGYIVIGLYHKYGRLWTNIRQALIKYFGNGFKFLDKRNFSNEFSEGKKKAWFNDQYKNPKESSHTYSEVLGWFEEANIDFVSSIPFSFPNGLKDDKLFKRKQKEGKLSIFVTELLQAFSLSQIKEGGFFIMVGKKPAIRNK